MDEFKQLKSSINEQIELLKRQLKEIKQKEELYNYRKELINIKDEEIITNKKRKELVSYYPFVEKKLSELDKLSYYIDKIKNTDFESINPFDFRIFISEINDENSQMIIDNFRKVKRIKSNIQIENEDDYNSSINNLVNELERIRNTFLNNLRSDLLIEFKKEFVEFDYGNAKNIIINEIEKIKKFDIFDKNGNIIDYFEDEEQLQSFYNWITNNIDVSLQGQIVSLLSNENLLKEELSKEEEISQNRDKLILDLQGELLDVDNLDLSNFSDEEKKIINEGIEIYKELREKIIERDDLLGEQDKLSIETKKSMYLLGNKYNWDMILSDIEDNIIPKINDDKENTINTFSLLRKLYNEKKQFNLFRSSVLKILLDQADSLEELIIFGSKYDTSQYDFVIEEKISEEDERFPKDVSKKQIEMSYYLNHCIKKELEKINYLRKIMEEKLLNDNIPDENDYINIEELKNSFAKFYKKAVEDVNSFKEFLKEEYKKAGIEIPNELSGKPNNLVFFLFDIDEDDVEKYKESYIKANKLLSSVKGSDMGEPKVKILYKDVKKEIEYDIPHVTIQRIRPLSDKRVGYIKFNASKKVMNVLKNRYGLGDDFEIYGLIGAVTKKSKNTEYGPILDVVKHNINELTNIGALFYGEETNLEELFQIIDNGLERMNRIANNDERKFE